MAKEWAKAFYKTKRWQKCKNAYISKRIGIDGGLCEECCDRPGYIVHHRITLTENNITDPDICLNENHLEYVCKICHDMFEGHGLNKRIKPLCRFDENGQPIPMREIDINRSEFE